MAIKHLFLLLVLSFPLSFALEDVGGSSASCNLLFDPFGRHDHAVVIRGAAVFSDNWLKAGILEPGTVGAVTERAFERDGKCWVKAVWLLRGKDIRERQTVEGFVQTGTPSKPYEYVIPSARFPCSEWGNYIERSGGEAEAVVISWQGTYAYGSPDEMPEPGSQPEYSGMPVGSTVRVKSYAMRTINGKTYCIVETVGDAPFRFAGTAEEGNLYIHPTDVTLIGYSMEEEPEEPEEVPAVEGCERRGGKIWITDKCTLDKAFSMLRDGDVIVLSRPGIYRAGFSTTKSFVITSPFESLADPDSYVIKSDITAFSSSGTVSIRGVKIVAPTAFSGNSVVIIQSKIEASGRAVDANDAAVVMSEIRADEAIKASSAVVINSRILSANDGKVGIEAERLVMDSSIVYGFRKCADVGEFNVGDSTFQECGFPSGYALRGSGFVAHSLFLGNKLGIQTGQAAVHGSSFIGNKVGMRGTARLLSTSFYSNEVDCSPPSGECINRCKRRSKFLFIFGFNGFKVSECPLPEIMFRVRNGDEVKVDEDVKGLPIMFDEGVFTFMTAKDVKIKGEGGKWEVPFSSSGIRMPSGKVEDLAIYGAVSSPEYSRSWHHSGVELFGGVFNAVIDSDISGFSTGIRFFKEAVFPENRLYHAAVTGSRIWNNVVGMENDGRDKIIIKATEFRDNVIGARAMGSMLMINNPKYESARFENNAIGILVDPADRVGLLVSSAKITGNRIGIYINNTAGSADVRIFRNTISRNGIGIRAERPDGIAMDSNTFESNGKDCEGLSC